MVRLLVVCEVVRALVGTPPAKPAATVPMKALTMMAFACSVADASYRPLRRVLNPRSPVPALSQELIRWHSETSRNRGLVPTVAADQSTAGPASLVFTDPDGNPIVIDRHISRPRR
jgi:hypothetical protein